MLGGTQSLHTNSRDEALALPTAEAARLALRTQQIIAHEAGVTETPDPLAGCYFVESLTDELEAAARPTSTRSTRWAARSPRSRRGFQQRQIQESAYRVQREIERGRPDRGRGQPLPGRRRGGAARRSSGSTRTASAARSRASGGSGPNATRRPGAPPCAASETAARGEDNLLPAIIEAVAAYATVGEICDRLRAAWGEHRELITV